MENTNALVRPLVQELKYDSPLKMARCFAFEPGVVFLHTAKLQEDLGRYSFLGVRPFDFLITKNGWVKTLSGISKGSFFESLKSHLRRFELTKHPDFPPFQGGGMGYLGYDLNRELEQLPAPRVDDLGVPEGLFAFYDLVFAWDHAEEKTFLFSSGLPFEGRARKDFAQARMADLLDFIQSPASDRDPSKKLMLEEAFVSNFSQKEYLVAAQKSMDHIYAGDIFEVNISQRFKARVKHTPFEIYETLQAVNPAPFSGYLNFPACQLISASPERFLKMSEKSVTVCPIKGTCRRDKDPQRDEILKQMLLHSEKNRAENIMIVDLMRNDLSKVCLPHSVQVPKCCELQTFETVHHLVSTVTGKLAPEYDVIDLLKATFPGGSITGAPKIRAMEIIAEIEPTARGPYCGSMGYIDFSGDCDFSILIRTFVMKRDILTFQVGGAIVADSSPESEYEETLVKAEGMWRVFR